MNTKPISANRAGNFALAALFGKAEIFAAVRANPEPVSFKKFYSQALPFKPALYFSDVIGIIGSDEQSVKPLSLSAAPFDIFRQHPEHGKAENRKRKKIEYKIYDTVSHKRSDTVQQKIQKNKEPCELVEAVSAVHKVIQLLHKVVHL